MTKLLARLSCAPVLSALCVSYQATLSKAIEVNYGRKRDEMVAMILQVTKTLQCPIRISKLQLINRK